MMLSMGVAVDVLVEMLFFMGVSVEIRSMGVAVDVLVEMLSMGVAVTGAASSEMIDQKPCA